MKTDSDQCKRGHKYGGANALAHGRGKECRECKNLRRREARAEANRQKALNTPLAQLSRRLTAFGLECVMHGDMTPAAEMKLQQILAEAQS